MHKTTYACHFVHCSAAVHLMHLKFMYIDDNISNIKDAKSLEQARQYLLCRAAARSIRRHQFQCGSAQRGRQRAVVGISAGSGCDSLDNTCRIDACSSRRCALRLPVDLPDRCHISAGCRLSHVDHRAVKTQLPYACCLILLLHSQLQNTRADFRKQCR